MKGNKRLAFNGQHQKSTAFCGGKKEVEEDKGWACWFSPIFGKDPLLSPVLIPLPCVPAYPPPLEMASEFQTR